jgi:hypothetical protein
LTNLSDLIKNIKSFLKIKWYDKKFLLEAFFLTGVSRIIMLHISFNKYSKHFGIHNEETSFETSINDYKTIKRVSCAVYTASKHTPWESKCLVQAMTAQRMLKSRKLCSTLYLGVNKGSKDNLQAHAWLRCGQIYVTGGYNKNEFKEVARFANSILHK